MLPITLKDLKQSLQGQRDAVLWRLSQRSCSKVLLASLSPSLPCWLPVFILARFLLSCTNVLSATSKELKRHLSFNLLERVMIRGFQKVPI